jgi:hypothetical protein
VGLFFRKSINLGGVRINLSKSGVGFSTGVKGFRYSVGPRGAYVNIGRNGVYYRKKISSPRSAQRANQRQYHESDQPDEVNHPDADDHPATADVSELVDASSHEVIDHINENMRRPARAPVIRWGAVIVACLVAQLPVGWHWIAGFIVLIPGLICAAAVDGDDRAARTTPLFYELQDSSETDFQKILNAFASLATARRISLVQGVQHVSDWKRNAGASSEITTAPASILLDQHPPFIATNLIAPCIKINFQKLFFFPDRILIFQGRTYGAVSYDVLSVDYTTAQFIESGTVPKDTQVVGSTWLKVNKDGSRDKRFANNRQLPIALYGYLLFHSDSGLKLSLQISNAALAEQFSKTFNPATNKHSKTSKQAEHVDTDDAPKKQKSRRSSKSTKASSADSNPVPESPYQVLGLEVGASPEEISAAYRRLAKMYHPDRVADLGPEFAEIAERKMKQINAAYEEIQKKFA